MAVFIAEFRIPQRGQQAQSGQEVLGRHGGPTLGPEPDHVSDVGIRDIFPELHESGGPEPIQRCHLGLGGGHLQGFGHLVCPSAMQSLSYKTIIFVGSY